MNLQILLGLLLTVLPISELRGGLPVIVEYSARNGISIWPWFIIVLLLNIIVIFFIFFFLDFLHKKFMVFNFYRRFMDKYLEKVRVRAEKMNKKINNFGFLALVLFVAIPLPGTGAWTGTLIAWTLELERWKSILAIAVGVLIAGILILLASLGVLGGIGY